jgi:adenosine deaminase CECR1
MKFRLFFFILIICIGCRSNAEYTITPGGFRFSDDLHLSPAEKRADSVLNAKRSELLTRKGYNWSLFKSFTRTKTELQKENLYTIFKKMPKGGLVHVHATAAGDVDWMIGSALSMPECYIYWDEENAEYTPGQLAFFPDKKIPPGWLPVKELALSDPGLKTKLYALYTLGPEEEDLPDPWIEFEKIFKRVGGFIYYKPVFNNYFKYTFDALAEEGIQFVELRTSIGTILNEDGTVTKDEAVIELYERIASEVRAAHPFFDVRIIANTGRGGTLETAGAQVLRINRFSAQYPEMIVGFDLVGEEAKGSSNGYFSTVLLNCQVPLFLHGGESVSASNHNIRDAVDLNARRIGHGLNLFCFPDLEKTLLANKTLLEICPISNQELQYVSDFRLHPAVGYLQRGVQATLGSDDPAFFQSRGLTDDYFVAYLAWGLDLRSVKKLVLNSIIYGGQSHASEQVHLDFFNKKWDEFIQDVNKP